MSDVFPWMLFATLVCAICSGSSDKQLSAGTSLEGTQHNSFRGRPSAKERQLLHEGDHFEVLQSETSSACSTVQPVPCHVVRNKYHWLRSKIAVKAFS